MSKQTSWHVRDTRRDGYHIHDGTGTVASSITWEPHATLIAAAPELLHAAITAREVLEACVQPATGVDDASAIRDALWQLNAAINKAGGWTLAPSEGT